MFIKAWYVAAGDNSQLKERGNGKNSVSDKVVLYNDTTRPMLRYYQLLSRWSSNT